MRTAGIGSTLLLACGLTGAAWAQRNAPVVGVPVPDFKYENKELQDTEKHFVAEMRGRILVFFFWRSTNLESLEAVPIINRIRDNFRAQGVIVCSFTSEAKEKADKVEKEKDMAYHWNAWGDFFADQWDVVSVPQVFLIDPNGVLAWKGHPADDLEQRVRDQIRRTPPLGADEAALRARLDKAEALHQKGEHGKAYSLARSVALVTERSNTEKGSSLNEKAKAMEEKLLEAARKWLEEARAASRAGDDKAACRIVAEVSVRFATDEKEGPVRELVAAADTEIGRLRADNRTKTMVDKAVENARGEVKLDEAAELEAMSPPDFVGAMRLYRAVFDDMPKADAGKAAKEALDRIASDPKIQARIREHRAVQQAERWFDMGERYARLQMPAQAREMFEKIIAEHPRTPAAAKAREALKKLAAADGAVAAESRAGSKP